MDDGLEGFFAGVRGDEDFAFVTGVGEDDAFNSWDDVSYSTLAQ